MSKRELPREITNRNDLVCFFPDEGREWFDDLEPAPGLFWRTARYIATMDGKDIGCACQLGCQSSGSTSGNSEMGMDQIRFPDLDDTQRAKETFPDETEHGKQAGAVFLSAAGMQAFDGEMFLCFKVRKSSVVRSQYIKIVLTGSQSLTQVLNDPTATPADGRVFMRKDQDLHCGNALHTTYLINSRIV